MARHDTALLSGLIETCRDAIALHAETLCDLDRAIGDGDHGTNLRRGCEAVHAQRVAVAALPLAQALERIGTLLVMSVGGASGPLYGTLLIELGRALAGRDTVSPEDLAVALRHAVAAVARRGRTSAGDKTLLDVLYPVAAALSRQATLPAISRRARISAGRTAAMQARRGRAAFLGERSIGHVDPGASSCALMTAAICRYLQEHRPQ
ncbi:dihydroxyacetone kinase subunit DhaL [Ensifer soli]|uniref:dihydroxyacetone kinase subunit DhaL n=1 Tax=Ciceribacter sp. sgz301302 TaxID=3342379 RepID=UPI0035B77F1C